MHPSSLPLSEFMRHTPLPDRALPAAMDGERIGRMTRRLIGDFSNGIVGTRFNTFQHRSRVIRQLNAGLAAEPAAI